jgi:hypothetical protein
LVSPNSRVLEYDSPFTLDRAADRVFGQDGSFTMASCNGGGTASALTLCKPFGVGVDTSGNLYVADSRNNRVLEYDSPLSTDATADQVFGQAENLTSTKCNIGGLVAAKTLCRPQGVAADPWWNVYIADTGNNRVLAFSSPLATDRRADLVFGQSASFVTSDCNKGGGVNRRTLCGPSGVAVDASGDVFIADSLNHRVLEYDSSLTTDVRADRVFGQGESFSSATCTTEA